MRRTQTEPWDVWYPKARAAYEQITSNSTPEEIRGFYKDVTRVPSYVTYAAEEVGKLDQPDSQYEAAFFATSLRAFKEQFGDSDSYLAVLSDGEPVFIVGNGNLDEKSGNIVICSLTKSSLGKSVTYRRTTVLQIVDRQGLLAYFLTLFTPDSRKEVETLLFGIVLFPITIPLTLFLLVKSALDRQEAESKNPGWGWLKDGTMTITKALQDSPNDDTTQFVNEAGRMTRIAFADAINASHTRGARVHRSQLTGQGMPPNQENT